MTQNKIKWDLLSVNLVGFVQNNTDFVVVTTKRSNDTLEFVTDIKFVGVKEEKNEIAFGSKPRRDPREIIAALCPLLFSREDSRSVDKCDVLQKLT